ncbi:MAG: putative ABC transport system permease protein [Candidatus Latescibacterota bacterium]|jgi:putative ABC transport system permease protein
MFSNYLTIAIRNLLRQKRYTLINLFGLAIGLSCCVIALSIIYHEYSFNRFHPQAKHTYRILRERISNDQKQVRWLTSGALARTIEDEIPEIEYASKNRFYNVNVRVDNRTQFLNQGHVDGNFFKLFNFPFIQGNATSLKQPYHIAITQHAAKQLFGTTDPIGKTITIQERYYGGDYTISAILQNPPTTSTLQFDLIHQTNGRTPEAIFDWAEWQGRVQQAGIETYIRLRPGTNLNLLEDKISDIIERHMGTDVRKILTYRLQPLLRLHLYSLQDYNLPTGGNINTLYLFAAIALLILTIASINFVNLSTARATSRAREVALRKVVGAQRGQIINQFLGESTFLALLALILALPFARIVLTQLNTLLQTQYTLDIHTIVTLLPLLIALTLMVGLIAGLYPAFYLSAFHPAQTLNNTKQSARFRQMLVITQFAIAIVLIVGTTVVDRQLTFIQNKDLGFDKDQLVVLPIFVADRDIKTNDDPWLVARYNTVKQTFLEHPNIHAISAFRFLPGKDQWMTRIVKPEGQDNTEWRMPVQETDEDLFNALGAPLLAGRTFSPENERDRTHSYILNKTAVNALGWTVENAVGRRFGRARSEEDVNGIVIGIVDDFHAASLHTPIAPTAFAYRQWFYNYLILRVSDFPATRPFLEKTWTHFMPPEKPFTFSFLNDELNTLYQAERDLQNLVTSFSILAILLACLGLFGLAAFTTERRTKEMGIRKVLGASTTNIILLLSTNFLKLVLLSNLIAWPIAYYFTQKWLDEFAYRITLNIWPFILSGVLALIIAFLTVSYQAIKAAHTNPVDTLRHE